MIVWISVTTGIFANLSKPIAGETEATNRGLVNVKISVITAKIRVNPTLART